MIEFTQYQPRQLKCRAVVEVQPHGRACLHFKGDTESILDGSAYTPDLIYDLVAWRDFGRATLDRGYRYQIGGTL